MIGLSIGQMELAKKIHDVQERRRLLALDLGKHGQTAAIRKRAKQIDAEEAALRAELRAMIPACLGGTGRSRA